MLYGRIDLDDWTLVVGGSPGAPCRLLWLGERLGEGIALSGLPVAALPPPHGNRPDLPAPLGLWTVGGRGCLAQPALELSGAARGRGVGLALAAIRTDPDAVTVSLSNAAIRIEARFERLGNALQISTKITNLTDDPITFETLASLALPLPDWARTAYPLSGRWADEWHTNAVPLLPDTVLSKQSQEGRPGFSGAQFVLLGDAGLAHQSGQALGLTLLWPGAARQSVERLSDGQAQVQIGPVLSGGLSLAPGEDKHLPQTLLAYSANGRNGLRSAFHDVVSASLPAHACPRPVHFNTWEAAYFNVSATLLEPLIARAAALGAERFVLDDGWFAGRTSDEAALGDWTADPDRFPDGLKPIAEAVQAAGMRFGLWIEPEMISPRSMLYATHPDWALRHPGGEAPTQRHQLALDLTRPAVRDHLVETLDRLLASAPISYLKWDHNRPLFPDPGSAQIEGFLDILDRVRTRHPHVDLELCASGGGRVDLSLFSRFSRLWPTDATDPLVRARVQENLSVFVPPFVMGGHVGASPNPITSGQSAMAVRVLAAFFSHFGIEADPTHLSAEDFAVLKAGIALWKQYRGHLALGRHQVLDSPEGLLVETVTARDASQMLVRVLNRSADRHAAAMPAKIALPGLPAASRWRVCPLWPLPTTVPFEAEGSLLSAAPLDLFCPDQGAPAPFSGGLAHLVRIG